MVNGECKMADGKRFCAGGLCRNNNNKKSRSIDLSIDCMTSSFRYIPSYDSDYSYSVATNYNDNDGSSQKLLKFNGDRGDVTKLPGIDDEWTISSMFTAADEDETSAGGDRDTSTDSILAGKEIRIIIVVMTTTMMMMATTNASKVPEAPCSSKARRERS